MTRPIIAVFAISILPAAPAMAATVFSAGHVYSGDFAVSYADEPGGTTILSYDSPLFFNGLGFVTGSDPIDAGAVLTLQVFDASGTMIDSYALSSPGSGGNYGTHLVDSIPVSTGTVRFWVSAGSFDLALFQLYGSFYATADIGLGVRQYSFPAMADITGIHEVMPEAATVPLPAAALTWLSAKGGLAGLRLRRTRRS